MLPLSFLKRFGVQAFDFWICPNSKMNLFWDLVSDLTSKPDTDSDSRPNPKDSVKSIVFHLEKVEGVFNLDAA